MTRRRPYLLIAACALAIVPAARAAEAPRPPAAEAYAAFCMAVAAVERDHFPKAVEWFKEALKTDPASADCHVWLGTVYSEKMRKPRTGRRHYEKALTLAPGNFRARYGIAKQLLRDGHHEDAVKEIESAVEALEPDTDTDLVAKAYTDLAAAAELNGEPDKAVEYLTKAAEKASNRVYILFRLANLHLTTGNREKAIEVLVEIKRLVPGYPKIHRQLCDLYKAAGKWSEALDELLAYMKHRRGPGERMALLDEAAGLAKRAGRDEIARGLEERVLDALTRRYPPDRATPKMCRNIGTRLERAGRLAEAAPYLEKTVADTENPNRQLTLRERLAMIYERLGQTDRAAGHLRACIEAVKPKDSVRYRTELCAVLEAARRYDEAEAALREILALPDARVTGLAELGLFFRRRGKTDQAAENLKKAIEIAEDKKGIRYRVQLSLTYAEAGREAEAEAVLVEARKLFPDNASVNNALGWHYAERGVHLDRALELVRKAVEAQPANPYYLDSLGWVYFKQGRKEAALTELQRAAKLCRDAIIWDHLGDVYHALGKDDEAKEHWLRSLEFDPGLKRVRDKVDKLGKPK